MTPRSSKEVPPYAKNKNHPRFGLVLGRSILGWPYDHARSVPIAWGAIDQ
jgi:hypothetical protein